MPAWLLRFLPHIGIALAIIAAVAWIDHRGYQRARNDQKALEQRLTQKITDEVAKIDTDLAKQLGSIDQTRTIIQPTLTREFTHETRYSDPACALTDGVFGAINAARSASAPGAGGGGVPTPRPAD